MRKEGRAERQAVLWPCRIQHPEKGVLTGNVLNISPSGVGFLSPTRCGVGSVLEMEICFTAAAIMRCRVRITRESPERLGRYVCGAQFEQFYAKGKQLLHSKLLGI